MTSLTDLCRWALENGVSDLHLAAEQSPFWRVDGQLAALDANPIPAGRLEDWLFSILNADQRHQLRRRGQLLWVGAFRSQGRVRLQVVRERQGWSVSARTIRAPIPGLEALGMPEVMLQWARQRRGLVLIGGLGGSGRSTTAAAFVQAVRASRPASVKNFENPSEIIDSTGDSRADVLMIPRLQPRQWARAMRRARRQLVVAVCDALDVWRMLQPALACPLQICDRVLLGAVVQRLVPRATPPGRVAAVEVMVNNEEIREMLRRGSLFRLYNVMQTDRKYAMSTLEQALYWRVKAGEISAEVALQACVHPEDLRPMLERLR